MIGRTQALELILERAKPLGGLTVPLALARGLALSAPVVSAENLPPFDNSAMDGFALRSADTAQASAGSPAALAVVGEVRAGGWFQSRVLPGQAVKIMTGAPLPDGCDAVLPVEESLIAEGMLIVRAPVGEGRHVRFAGEDVAPGTRVLEAGTILGPGEAGLLAALGIMEVGVTRPPLVAYLATGDELLEPSDQPARGRIRDATSWMLASALAELPVEAEFHGRVSDTPQALDSALGHALQRAPDVLLVTGGVSAGDYDFVKSVLEARGLESVFHKVDIKPGKPLLFGVLGQTLVFGLPGNPVSSLLTFYAFARPAIWALAGRDPRRSTGVPARAEIPIVKKDPPEKALFLRVEACRRDGEIWVRPIAKQGSHMLSSLAGADGYVEIPEGRSEIPAGERVEVHFFRASNAFSL